MCMRTEEKVVHVLVFIWRTSSSSRVLNALLRVPVPCLLLGQQVLDMALFFAFGVLGLLFVVFVVVASSSAWSVADFLLGIMDIYKDMQKSVKSPISIRKNISVNWQQETQLSFFALDSRTSMSYNILLSKHHVPRNTPMYKGIH